MDKRAFLVPLVCILPSRAMAENHAPALPDCSATLNANQVSVTRTSASAQLKFVGTIGPAHATGDSVGCGDMTFVRADGLFDSVTFTPLFDGPNVTSDGFDCSHTAVMYALYNKNGLGTYSLSTSGILFGKLVGTTCTHDISNFASQGGNSATVGHLGRDPVFSVVSWTHNDTAIGHPGNLCSTTNCWWPTFVFVSGKPHLHGDIALTGGINWSSIPVAIPVALASDNGLFRVTNKAVSDFPAFATHTGARPVPGDFNGDGLNDIALTGGANWGSIPVAFGDGLGGFTVTNKAVASFPLFATHGGATPVSGDFNGDGRTDIALTGGVNWSSIPVAFSSSSGDGTFDVTNMPVVDFPGFAAHSGAKVVAGDFDGDGRGDIALVGGAGWMSIPVAYSNGTDGTFRVTNMAVADFPGFATQSGAVPVAGDFDGDGLSDIALTGGANWSSIPVAFSNGKDGTFRVTNMAVADFPGFATHAGAKPVTGDFNDDGLGDIALTGGVNWGSIPVAFSNGRDGTFHVKNVSVNDFPGFATQPGAKPVGSY